MITQKIHDSAYHWCREHTKDAENSVGLIVKFLESCNDDQRGEWLYRGWGKIWERVQDNLNIEPYCNERRKPTIE